MKMEFINRYQQLVNKKTKVIINLLTAIMFIIYKCFIIIELQNKVDKHTLCFNLT